MPQRTKSIASVFHRLKTNKKYKDFLFRYVFKDKSSLLLLYNALNHTNYTDIDQLEVNTLEDVIYIGYKNDISFLISKRLVLYEHQSSFNPNMPLRGLFYFSDMYREYVGKHALNIYGSTRLKLPTPQYIIFYNGTEELPDRSILHFSDSFEDKTIDPAVEVTATMLNINYGHNLDLLNQCKPLMDYSIFISQVRLHIENNMSLNDAIQYAVTYCLDRDILTDVLKEVGAKAMYDLLRDFNMKKYLKYERKEAYNDGFSQGLEDGVKQGIEQGIQQGIHQGIQQGEEALSTLIQALIRDDRYEDIQKAASDPSYRKTLFQEYHIK